ncbi:hypothetical protein ACWC0A_36300 [Streptomyces scopuliridis]
MSPGPEGPDGPGRIRRRRGWARAEAGATAPVTDLDALAEGRAADEAGLIVAYLAAPQAETGRPVPADTGALPAVLRPNACPGHRLPAPGVLLLARRGDRPI